MYFTRWKTWKKGFSEFSGGEFFISICLFGLLMQWLEYELQSLIHCQEEACIIISGFMLSFKSLICIFMIVPMFSLLPSIELLPRFLHCFLLPLFTFLPNVSDLNHFFAKLCDFWDSSRNSECNLLILRCYGKMLLSFWNVHEAKFLQEVTDNRRGSIRLTAIEGGWNDNKEMLLKSVMFRKLLIPNTYTIFETT